MFLSQSDLAARWGLSLSTLQRMKRARSDFPRSIRLSPGRIAFALADVEAFEQALFEKAAQ